MIKRGNEISALLTTRPQGPPNLDLTSLTLIPYSGMKTQAELPDWRETIRRALNMSCRSLHRGQRSLKREHLDRPSPN